MKGPPIALPNVVEVDVQVVINARVPIPASATDEQLAQSVLAQLALLAPFASRVQTINVTRSGVVGVVKM